MVATSVALPPTANSIPSFVHSSDPWLYPQKYPLSSCHRRCCVQGASSHNGYVRVCALSAELSIPITAAISGESSR